jgi:hypothetical protein
MSQFINIRFMAHTYFSRGDIVSDVTKSISDGRKVYDELQKENARQLAEAKTPVEKAEVTARIANADADWLREEKKARDYMSQAAANESFSGLGMLVNGLFG